MKQRSLCGSAAGPAGASFLPLPRHLTLVLVLIFLVAVPLVPQSRPSNRITVFPDSGKTKISRYIYSHFSEHLGSCIYGGIWVGETSAIPNTRGIRNDVVAALRRIRIPALRWPGGCFADEYHWMNGIGPRAGRPRTVNSSWGGVIDDNSFGTHEFMDLCEQLGCEPVICGNIGSGTVKEMSDWVDYLTSEGATPMAELRKANGREKPWNVTYWSVGNETWGCGGVMSPDFYANEFARYAYFLKNRGGNTLIKVASGGREDDILWTETIMKKWKAADGWLQGYLGGYSLHYYTVCHDWTTKGSATDFDEEEWFTTLAKTLRMEELIAKHSAVMDMYDPDRKIGLVVDEWGNWHDVEPGTNPGFLYQQNTLRDAMVAGLNLNIFNRHCDRVRMANIAQMVNVLQALILTDGATMLLTPTYHVFDLYKVHQDATSLPFELVSEEYSVNGRSIPALSATASVDSAGRLHLSIVNVNPDKAFRIPCTFKGRRPTSATGRILTAERMQDHNTFDTPDRVTVGEFRQVAIAGNDIIVDIPAKSIVTLEIAD